MLPWMILYCSNWVGDVSSRYVRYEFCFLFGAFYDALFSYSLFFCWKDWRLKFEMAFTRHIVVSCSCFCLRFGDPFL